MSRATPSRAGSCFLVEGQALPYRGGPVQTEPQLYLLWWGSNWENTGPEKEVAGALLRFYENLAAENEIPKTTSAWQGIIDQYIHVAGPYHNAKVVAEKHITSIAAPQAMNRGLLFGQVQEWIEQLRSEGRQLTQNTQIVVLPAPHSTFETELVEPGTCGFHTTDGPFRVGPENEQVTYSFSLVPYDGDTTCPPEGEKEGETEAELKAHAAQFKIDATTDTASHEFAESVTDPVVARYVDGEKIGTELGWRGYGEQNEEIADQCENKPGFQLPHSTYVTKLWDNGANFKCDAEDPPYPSPPPPSAGTGEAQGILGRSAALTGTVNPNGVNTEYYFEYGTSTSYGSSAPVPRASALYGDTATMVSASLAGLSPGMTYHYRLVATNWVGTSDGNDEVFKTPIPPPVVKTTGATNVGEVRADLQGTVNAEGFATSYQVEYWPLAEPTAITAVPQSPVNIGAEAVPVPVTQHVTGLRERTEYAYRITATNGGGESRGTEATFMTGPSTELVATPNPSGSVGADLGSVSCVSSVMCLAVGEWESLGGIEGREVHALAELWNGVEWAVVSPPVPAGASESSLSSVSCFKATACTAVGRYETEEVVSEHERRGVPHALTERWSGTAWTREANPAETTPASELTGVSCPSASVCEAIGGNLAEGWASGVWSTQGVPEVPEENLEEVSCTSAKACEAVGSFLARSAAAHWNGKTWTAETTTSLSRALSCVSATVCVAVGSKGGAPLGALSGTAATLSGGKWAIDSLVYPNGATEDKLASVSCVNETSCVATGSYKNASHEWLPWVEELAGSQWQVHAVPDPAGAETGAFNGTELSGVSCLPTTECTAVGTYINSSGTPVTLAETTGPPVAKTEAAAPIASTEATLRGNVRPNGRETRYYFEYGTTTSYGAKTTSVELPSENRPEAVSAVVTSLASGTTYHYRLVAVNADGTVAGVDKTLSTPAAWHTVATPNPSGSVGRLGSVSCVSSVMCLAVGEWESLGGIEGREVHALAELWNGVEWAVVSPPVPAGASESSLWSVSCFSGTACTAVGRYETEEVVSEHERRGVPHALTERWSGTAWTREANPAETTPASELTGVSCASRVCARRSAGIWPRVGRAVSGVHRACRKYRKRT